LPLRPRKCELTVPETLSRVAAPVRTKAPSPASPRMKRPASTCEPLEALSCAPPRTVSVSPTARLRTLSVEVPPLKVASPVRE
jgi:hypothetical protein